MIGQLLGNRYEIIEEIGSGGMACVYRAKCRLLNRYVAVKALRKELINDSEFLTRFQTEAQAAASLSHPNIVSIYDVGMEKDVYYIIMEYVEGGSLKDYINNNQIIDWQTAVNFAIQICQALEHAHRNRIIHQDIKPHNILMSRDGILKVTDFGIARAVTSTQTIAMGSNTVGSVHYFSPEQARGGYTDERSDIYSLGIVMYEMLTGHVPFYGENPVAVALKHISEPPAPLKAANPNVPISVEYIVLRAMSKETAGRYASASEMLRDLLRAKKEPNTQLSAYNEMTPDAVNLDQTRKMAAIAKPTELQKITTQNKSNSDKALRGKGNPDIRNGEENMRGKGGKLDKQSKQKQGGNGCGLTALFALLTCILLLVAGAFTVNWFLTADTNWNLLDLILGPSREQNVEIPHIVGQNYYDIQQAYASGDIRLEVTEESPNNDKPAGMILTQEPEAGDRKVKLPAVIKLTISAGKAKIVLESYKGQQAVAASLSLKNLGLVPVESPEFSEDIPEGIVIRTSPEVGTELQSGDTVTIYVSQGIKTKMIIMPSIEDLPLQDALLILNKNNLLPGDKIVVPSDKPKDFVVRQSVSRGVEVPIYDEIDIEVSDGSLALPEEEVPPDELEGELPLEGEDPENPSVTPPPFNEEEPEQTQNPTPSPSPSPDQVPENTHRTKYINIPLPTNMGDIVKVTVYQDGAPIYNNNHLISDGSVEIPVTFRITANIGIYFNDVLAQNMTVN